MSPSRIWWGSLRLTHPTFVAFRNRSYFHSRASTSRCTYLARMSVSRFTLPPDRQRAERRHRQGVGNQRHAETIRLALDDRQAHAVHGDRALGGHLPGQAPGHGEPKGGPVAVIARAPASVPTPSMWPLTKCPPSRSPTARARSRFTGLPGRSSPRLVRASVSGPAWKAERVARRPRPPSGSSR